MKIRVSSSNFFVLNHQPDKDAKFLGSLGIDLAGIQEGMGRNVRVINNVLSDANHEVFWATRNDPDKQRAMEDVPVVINTGRIHVFKKWARKLSDTVQKQGTGHSRAVTMVRGKIIGHTRKFTFFNTHLNAAVQNHHTTRHFPVRIKRVGAYVASMVLLEFLIRKALLRGELVIVTGDLNFTNERGSVWKFGPTALFERLGLNHVNHGLDWIAFSKDFSASNLQVISKNRTGSDHDWLVLDLSA